MPAESESRLTEEYRAALQTYFFEGQAFWNRITAFVLLNSALLVARNALPSGTDSSWMRVGISALGLSAVVTWGHTAVRAHYLIGFWLALLRDIESRLGMESSAPYHSNASFVSGRPVRLPGGTELRLPWYARMSVNDSTSAVLTTVFGVVWLVSLVRQM